MNYNPSPRSEFAKNPQLVAKHRDLVQNPNLRLAVENALLQYQREQCDLKMGDIGACAAGFLRLQGAQQFIELLYNLSESEAPVKTADVVNLPGNLRTKGN